VPPTPTCFDDGTPDGHLDPAADHDVHGGAGIAFLHDRSSSWEGLRWSGAEGGNEFIHHLPVENPQIMPIPEGWQAGGLLHACQCEAQPVIHDVHQHQPEFRVDCKAL
jgi:hypothetical protein